VLNGSLSTTPTTAPTAPLAAITTASAGASGCCGGSGGGGGPQAPLAFASVSPAPTTTLGPGIPGTEPITQPLAAIQQLIQQRQAASARMQTQIAQDATGNADKANAEKQIQDARDATTRRMQGLAAIMQKAGSLTSIEVSKINDIVNGNVDGAGESVAIGNESDIVGLASQIEERAGMISPAVYQASAAAVGLVSQRQRFVNQSMMNVINGNVTPDASIWQRTQSYNDMTSAIGTGINKVQQLGAKVTDQEAQAILAAANSVMNSVDPTKLLNTINAVIQEASAS
jgi:hypothetical protein